MATFLLTLLLTGLAVAGLAVGLLAGRKPIAGSCGGLACAGLSCDTCPNRRPEGRPDRRREE